MARPKIGQVLLEMGFLDQARLNSALAYQKQWGTPLARAVVERRFCTLDQAMLALSRQTGLSLIDLPGEKLDPGLAAIVPVKVAEQHHLVPIRVEGARAEVLVIAIAAPASIASLDAVRSVSRKTHLKAFLASDEAIERALGVIHRGEQPAAPAFQELPVDAREQEYNPVSSRDRLVGEAELAGRDDQLPVAAPAGPPDLGGLSLTAECVRVIRRAAEHHGISEKAVVERVIEAWTSRQRGA